MDEPLSNLDAKLRVQMRSELKRVQQYLNATAIYVTKSTTVVVSVAPEIRLAPDQPVWLGFDQRKLHLFDAATGQALPPA